MESPSQYYGKNLVHHSTGEMNNSYRIFFVEEGRAFNGFFDIIMIIAIYNLNFISRIKPNP